MYSGFSTDHIKPNMPFKYQYIVVVMKSLIHLIKQNSLGSAIHQQYRDDLSRRKVSKIVELNFQSNCIVI